MQIVAHPLERRHLLVETCALRHSVQAGHSLTGRSVVADPKPAHGGQKDYPEVKQKVSHHAALASKKWLLLAAVAAIGVPPGGGSVGGSGLSLVAPTARLTPK